MRKYLFNVSNLFSRYLFSNQYGKNRSRHRCTNTEINLDLNYICNPKNIDEITTNISRRKTVANVTKVQELYSKLTNSEKLPPEEKKALQNEFLFEASKIPNKTHPVSWSLPGEHLVLETTDSRFVSRLKKYKSFEEVSKKLKMLRTEGLSDLTGPRSYYLFDLFAQLEQVIINIAVSRLTNLGFELVSVPDILPRWVIDACGMSTTGVRTQVYQLTEEDRCLSGTAEMGIANLIAGRTFSREDLPKRYVASSRCYRAETSSIAEEKGIYRVHAFTKVEMFGISMPEDSEKLLNEFINLEKELLIDFGFKFRTIEMPPEDLGNQAYRKVDCEVWLPGRQKWAEVSSASDCTDFQSRRLGIKLTNAESTIPHTVNATAAAIPRLIMALVETHQLPDGSVSVPPLLRPYLNCESFGPSNKLPSLSSMRPHEFLK